MVPFWVLLDGLSPGRKKLLKGKSEDDDDDDDDDEAPAPGGFAPQFAPQGAMPSWAHPNLQRAPQANSGSTVKIIIFLVVGLVLLLMAVAVGGLLYLHDDDAPAPPPKAAPSTKGRR